MSDAKQTTTFRLKKETIESFRSYCEKNELTAAQGFDYLMEVLALDNARATLNTRETEISNFEQHAKALISAYLHSLELNVNAEARIREEYAYQIEGQARTISEYQNQISALKSQLEEVVSLAESFQEENTALRSSSSESEDKAIRLQEELTAAKEDKEKQLADKDSIISMLSAKLTSAEQKANDYDKLSERTEALQRDLASAMQTIKDKEKDAQIAQERAVRAAEKAIEAEHRKELEKLRSQNTELLQTIAGTEKGLNDQIRKLENEKADLREELATIKAKSENKQSGL